MRTIEREEDALADSCLKIDGLEIKDLGLHTLRKAITIIPQESIIMTASLRKNIDPFDHFKLEQIVKALKETNLLTVFVSRLEAQQRSDILKFDCSKDVHEENQIRSLNAMMSLPLTSQPPNISVGES